jgi:hypothetical protein
MIKSLNKNPIRRFTTEIRRGNRERKRRKCVAIFQNGEYPILKNRNTPFWKEDKESGQVYWCVALLNAYLNLSSSRNGVAAFLCGVLAA